MNEQELLAEIGTAVSVGKFDGLHAGHRKIVSELVRLKKEKNLKTVLISFNPTPAAFFGTPEQHFYIFDEKEFRFVTAKAGIDEVITVPFDESVAPLTAEEFIRDFLVKKYNMKAIVAGTDFRFGAKRSGDTSTLLELSSKYGYSVSVIEKEKKSFSEAGLSYSEISGKASGNVGNCKDTFEQNNLEDVSSSSIRKMISEGRVKEAGLLLCNNYFIMSEVVHGKGLGKKSLFPTINQILPDGKICPKYGVYVSRTIAGDTVYPSVTNVGINPTVENISRPVAETHILTEAGDLYGKTVRVEFIEFVRPERKFPDMESLREQISRDIEYAKKVLDTI